MLYFQISCQDRLGGACSIFLQIGTHFYVGTNTIKKVVKIKVVVLAQHQLDQQHNHGNGIPSPQGRV